MHGLFLNYHDLKIIRETKVDNKKNRHVTCKTWRYFMVDYLLQDRDCVRHTYTHNARNFRHAREAT